MQGVLEWVGVGEVKTQVVSFTPVPVKRYLFSFVPGVGGSCNGADDLQWLHTSALPDDLIAHSITLFDAADGIPTRGINDSDHGLRVGGQVSKHLAE